MRLLIKRSEINKILEKNKLKHLNRQEKELILSKNLLEEAQYFPLDDNIELNKICDKKTIKVIGSITNFNYENKEIMISEANLNLKFILSKYESENLRKDLNKRRILAELTIRKHETDEYFVEKVVPILESKEENYRKILEFRKNISTEDWKNLILNTLGYDLSEETGILKELLLVRLLPYLEKNYSYIELGGFSTGKTTISELFGSGEKVSPTISEAQMIYNVSTKEDGLLFKKHVLYLDEFYSSEFKKSIQTALLQTLAGNQVQVRDHNNSKKSNVSLVIQGNVLNSNGEAVEGRNEYMAGAIFNKLKDSYNFGAVLDRINFFIAGWLIPKYEKIKVDEDIDMIPLLIFEDFLSIQFEKNDYSDLIKNLKVSLIGDNEAGRFQQATKKTISAFLKLIYPDKSIDYTTEESEIIKIISISVLGKYAINQGQEKYTNSYVDIQWHEHKKLSIDNRALIKNYIQVKNEIFDKNNMEIKNEEIDILELPWKNEEENITQEEILYERKLAKVEIPEELKHLLSIISDKYLKKEYENCYKIIVAYNLSPIKEKREEFKLAGTFFLGMVFIYKHFKLDKNEVNFLYKTIDIIKDYNNYSLFDSSNVFINSILEKIELINKPIRNLKDPEIEKIINKNLKNLLDLQKTLTFEGLNKILKN